MPNSFQQSHKCNPVKDILRMASLNCVKGKPYLQMACTQLGKTVIGKKVPAINICGNANKLISKGIDVSLFATLLKINPTPNFSKPTNACRLLLGRRVAESGASSISAWAMPFIPSPISREALNPNRLVPLEAYRLGCCRYLRHQPKRITLPRTLQD